MDGRVAPPWTAVLSDGQHSLVLYGLIVAALALLATLVRVRFTGTESHGVYRTASLTANAVVALAFVSYLAIVAAFLLGYRQQGGAWVPTGGAQLVWSVRYMDWTVTVPLLVVEVVAVSGLGADRARWTRAIGMALAALMVLSGFLGGIVLDGGRSFAAIAGFGIAGAVCFAVLYGVVLSVYARSLPRMPEAARDPYRGAIVLLLVVWFAYPIVYGLQGVTSGGAWAATGQLVLCAADMIAKIGFGSLIHRTAVFRSRSDEDADPTARRPRQPQADSVWVDQDALVRFDDAPEGPGRS